jgi:putative DNA primase/helicase
MWALLIGRPGIMKSPAMEDALKPLKILASAAREQFNLAKTEYDVRAATAKAKAKHAEKEAAKALHENKGDAFLRDLLKRHQAIEEEPTCRRYMATYASVEALGDLLRQNPNGLLVHRDEMLSLLDRLDEEGHADERGFYLTGWAGNSPYTFDRIGRGLDLHVEAVCLSMLGGTQPGRISQYLVHVRRGGRCDDGLIQRFGIMVWPDIPSNWNNVDRRPSREACDRAFRMFQVLDTLDWHVIGAKRDFGSTGDEVGDPYLRFSQGAHERFLVWRMELERRLRHDGLHPALESHLAKYRKLVPALALISHLSDSGTGDVSEAAIEKALKWAAYLETHAACAYASTTIASADAAQAILAKIKSGHLKSQFGSRDVWRPQWSRLTDRATVQEALQLLVDYDWLSVAAISNTGGRTATVYTVNPKVLAQ